MLKSDLTGDNNLVPKMGLAPQCNDYIAEIIRRALYILQFVGRAHMILRIHGEGSLFGGLVIESPCTSEQSG